MLLDAERGEVQPAVAELLRREDSGELLEERLEVEGVRAFVFPAAVEGVRLRFFRQEAEHLRVWEGVQAGLRRERAENALPDGIRVLSAHLTGGPRFDQRERRLNLFVYFCYLLQYSTCNVRKYVIDLIIKSFNSIIPAIHT